MQFKSLTTVLLIWALCGVDNTRAGWIDDLKAYFAKPEVREFIIGMMKSAGKAAVVEACKQAIKLWSGDAIDGYSQYPINDELFISEILSQMERDGMVESDTRKIILDGLKAVGKAALQGACDEVIEKWVKKKSDFITDDELYSEFMDNFIAGLSADNAIQQHSALDEIMSMDEGRLNDLIRLNKMLHMN